MPVVEAGRGRWRVLSRQYEAYVRDQCWTVEITEMRREEGRRGVERDRDYWGLGASTTGRTAARRTQTHTHSQLSRCVVLTGGGCTCPALQRLHAKPRVNKIVFPLWVEVCAPLSPE